MPFEDHVDVDTSGELIRAFWNSTAEADLFIAVASEYRREEGEAVFDYAERLAVLAGKIPMDPKRLRERNAQWFADHFPAQMATAKPAPPPPLPKPAPPPAPEPQRLPYKEADDDLSARPCRKCGVTSGDEDTRIAFGVCAACADSEDEPPTTTQEAHEDDGPEDADPDDDLY